MFLDKWFPKYRKIKSFEISTNDLRSKENNEPVTQYEQKSLDTGKCPDCEIGTTYQGPSGGMSTNIACGKCGSEFNYIGTMYQGPSCGMSTNIACGQCGSEFNYCHIPRMTHRNSTAGSPDKVRLRQIFHLALPE